MKIHFLKTEWSDIIILQQNGQYAMVDTGFDWQFPMIQEYLGALGVKKLDFILLTHFHRDHYGCLTLLLDNYQVDKVYLKEYSGLDCTTAWGSEADDAYRSSELEKYAEIQKAITEKSTLIQLEALNSVSFAGYEMKLYNSDNSIRAIYEDETNPESYHKICCSENQNSLGIFMEVDGKTVFLGGDILDHPSIHARANFVNLQIAKQIGREIDLYKAPHHGTYNTGLPETLAIYKPKTVVITNGTDYVTNDSDFLKNLKNANPSAKVLFTDKSHVVIETSEL